MDVLLREVTGISRGVPTYRDAELAGDQLTLGSAPDQNIQLLGSGVRGSHAVLTAAGAGLQVQGRRKAEVLVNGESRHTATLAPGDVLEVGGHRLVVVDAPAGFDAALELTRNPDVDSSAYQSAFTTDLDQTWLSRRTPAWVLLGLVAVFTLALPLTYVLLEDDGGGEPAIVPTDALWTSGPLHPAHELATGEDCSACHTELFHRVKDDDCAVCHDTLPDHLPAVRAAELELPQDRCATCHLEHNEPENLIDTADALCTDCHADPHQFAGPVNVKAASGFAAGTHPGFEARLLRSVAREAGTGLTFAWEPHTESVATAREASNLLFPHDVHLDPAKVRDPNDNSALACGDCHTPAADGEHFRPIDMEVHCASCHELTFDPGAPERQLPHGQPREVVFAIEGYYAQKFLDPEQGDQTPTRRRRPGRSADSGRCTDAPAECARQRTVAEVTNQFTARGCVTCHRVARTEADDLFSRYQVYPVRLVRDYYDAARFDHASHLTQEDKTGDAACLTCHAADVSNTSEDVLIPDMDNCTECHGDPSVPEVVTLQCVGCHEFHPRSPDTVLHAGDVRLEGVGR